MLSSSASCSQTSVATIPVVAAPTDVTPKLSLSPAPSPGQLDKSEINDAVTKVLQGYDWTLVPIATK